jgi:RNA polymerase sigma-32 factor
MAGLAGGRIPGPGNCARHERGVRSPLALSDALGVLNGRDRRIFEGRRLAENPITLVELADEFGVSGERVRQIEARAFEKVQKAVKNRVATIEMPVSLPMH